MPHNHWLLRPLLSDAIKGRYRAIVKATVHRIDPHRQWPGPARYRAKPSLVAAKNGRLSRPLLRFEIAEVMQSLHRTLARMTKT